MHKSSFSQLLTDLIMEAQSRQVSGGNKGPEQYLIQIVDLLEKNKALEAKLKEKDERLKRERRELTEALALCEADLKKARA
jgi:predicted  nucleic acid-binding Zn-ribbon protein